MFKFAALIALLVSFQAFAQSPCGKNQSNEQIDLYNSDDLFFAAKFLGRYGKNLEAIECLNLAKKIAPDYLDVRLELINNFIKIGDRKSATLEAKEYEVFPTNGYYLTTYFKYVKRIPKIKPVKAPIAGYEFVANTWSSPAPHYWIFTNDIIKDIELFKKVVKLRIAFKPKEARKLMDTQLLPANMSSPTVYFYSSMLYYDLGNTEMGKKHLEISIELTFNDADVILMSARFLNELRWYKSSLKLITAKISTFDTYGCFQLGSALKQIYEKTNPSAAVKLDKVLMYSLYNNVTDSQLCREIEHQFFKPTLF